MNLGPIRETGESSSSSNSSTTSLNTTQHANNSNNNNSSGALSNSLPERNEAWSTTLQQTQTNQQQQQSLSSPYRTQRTNSGNSNSSSPLNLSSASFYQSMEPASSFISSNPQSMMSFTTPHKNYPFEATSDYNNSKMETIKDKLGHHDGWHTLCANVLPLFNGEGLKMYIEDLNELLRECIRDNTPESLYGNINELLATGMSTLNSKLRDVPDEKLVSRLNELWSFYFGTVIPYFEGVFLPLQMQANNNTTINIASHNTSNGMLSSTSTIVTTTPTNTFTTTSNTSINEEFSVRRMVLMSFRDQVILPMGDRVDDAFNKLFHDFDSGIPVADTAARMLQMTYILSSILSNDEKQSQMDRILAKLKNNWKLFMRRDRRGSAVTTPTTPTPNVAGISGTVSGIALFAFLLQSVVSTNLALRKGFCSKEDLHR
ncbi:11349_t:CDS:2, partial [Ambispora leptoticha]